VQIKPNTIKVVLIFTFYLLITKSFGQTNKSSPAVFCPDSVKKETLQWANLGFGNSTDNLFNSIAGLNVALNYHWKPKRITFLAGGSATSELLNYENTLYVINGGIGKTINSRSYNLSLLAGPGIMWGNHEGDNFVKPGLSINAELIIKLIKGLGLGLEFYSNLNAIQNSTGARIIIHLNNEKKLKF